MTRMLPTMAVALMTALWTTPVAADVIYSKTGTFDAGLVNHLIGVSWEQATPWADVAVSLEVYNYGPVGVTTSAMVYLLDSIGPGTTQADNEIASATISSNVPGAQTVTPFAGLTLGPGTYYLAYMHTAGAIVEPAGLLAWLANISGTATTTLAADVIGLDGFRNSSALPAYAPAASTLATSDTTNPLFNITGTPKGVPEPATFALMLGSAAGMALRARRRRLLVRQPSHPTASPAVIVTSWRSRLQVHPRRPT